MQRPVFHTPVEALPTNPESWGAVRVAREKIGMGFVSAVSALFSIWFCLLIIAVASRFGGGVS